MEDDKDNEENNDDSNSFATHDPSDRGRSEPITLTKWYQAHSWCSVNLTQRYFRDISDTDETTHMSVYYDNIWQTLVVYPWCFRLSCDRCSAEYSTIFDLRAQTTSLSKMVAPRTFAYMDTKYHTSESISKTKGNV